MINNPVDKKVLLERLAEARRVRAEKIASKKNQLLSKKNVENEVDSKKNVPTKKTDTTIPAINIQKNEEIKNEKIPRVLPEESEQNVEDVEIEEKKEEKKEDKEEKKTITKKDKQKLYMKIKVYQGEGVPFDLKKKKKIKKMLNNLESSSEEDEESEEEKIVEPITKKKNNKKNNNNNINHEHVEQQYKEEPKFYNEKQQQKNQMRDLALSLFG